MRLSKTTRCTIESSTAGATITTAGGAPAVYTQGGPNPSTLILTPRLISNATLGGTPCALETTEPGGWRGRTHMRHSRRRAKGRLPIVCILETLTFNNHNVRSRRYDALATTTPRVGLMGSGPCRRVYDSIGQNCRAGRDDRLHVHDPSRQWRCDVLGLAVLLWGRHTKRRHEQELERQSASERASNLHQRWNLSCMRCGFGWSPRVLG